MYKQEDNLVELFNKSAHAYAEKTALFFCDRKISYRDLQAMSEKLSQGLKNIGVKKGDRVALFLQNSPEFVVGFFAIVRVGAICVPINNMFTEEELGFILRDAGAKIIITSVTYIEIVNTLQQHLPECLEYIIVTDGIIPGTLNFYEVIERSLPCREEMHIEENDIASILYTSGTTGNPKGAMLTHKNLISNISSCLAAIHPTDKDNFICVLPMFHSFAFTVCILIPIFVGSSITIIEHLRPFRRIVRNVIKKKVTVFVGIPSIFNVLSHMHIPPVFTSRILKLIDPLRICVSGAAALPVEVLHAFEEKFRVPLLEGYGLTEASPVVSLDPFHGKRKPGSVGLPIKDVQVKVVDDKGYELGPDKPGELLVKGPNVTKGYWNNDVATKEAIKEGWLCTGDIAQLDEEGYIYIVDRKKDMINVRGFNVYPAEVEKILMVHPKIKEAAVIGVSDKFKGEVPKAFIILKENQTMTAEEVIKHLREHLASFKIPKYAVFVESLPRTATGKVLKRQLKNM